MRPGRLALWYRSGGLWFALGMLSAVCVGWAGFAAWMLVSFRTDSRTLTTEKMLVVAMATSAMIGIVASRPLFWESRRRRQALFRELWPHRLAVCPTCWYPMQRHSDRCSECGREVVRRKVQQYWIGILFQPGNAGFALSEAFVAWVAKGRRQRRSWYRRHCNRLFKLNLFRGRALLPLRQ